MTSHQPLTRFLTDSWTKGKQYYLELKTLKLIIIFIQNNIGMTDLKDMKLFSVTTTTSI